MPVGWQKPGLEPADGPHWRPCSNEKEEKKFNFSEKLNF
jgi:hypothetical protein